MEWPYVVLVILPSLILFGLGYLIRFRKAYGLISGYNTMSPEKKQNVDVARLGKLVGNFCFAMGVVLLAGLLLLVFDFTAAGFGVLALLVPLIVYLLVTAQKYDSNNRQADGRAKTGAKIMVGVVVAIILLVASLTGYLLYRGSQPPDIRIDSGNLAISGLYGQRIARTDIEDIQLLDTLPHIEMRTNGSAVGDQLVGHFRLTNVGAAVLYVNRSKPPFIYLQTANQKIYFNLATPDLTREFFNLLLADRSKG
jgi:hypothetical protein